jgi:hypothetical protein
MKRLTIIIFTLAFITECSFFPSPATKSVPAFTITATQTLQHTPTRILTSIPKATATFARSEPTPPAKKTGPQVGIVLDPSLLSGDTSVTAAWLGYASARAEWIQSNITAEELAQKGYHRTFEEEVAARSSLAKIWKELKSSQTELKNTYLDELLKVYEAGFIKEYTWIFLATNEWSRPEGLRLDEFSIWSNKNIPNHNPETRADVEVTVKK